ncbi:MAG TPA: DUF2277 domain-containing protein [Dehalococcoidia bacterium]|jgi:hypothetical protein|nr:DUF2277 domain-containing protein [Dehalococcoidia bacterium]
MTAGFVYDPIFLEHDTGDHPENASRMAATIGLLDESRLLDRVTRIPDATLRGGRRTTMCRSIKTLRRKDEDATDEEIHAAALQFVRKVSGYRQPSKANADAFDAAVDEIARTSRRLLEGLQGR